MNPVYRNASAHGPVTELCYITSDIEHAIAAWVDLIGAGPFFTHEFALDYEDGGNRSQVPVIAALGASGTTIIEIIQPLTGPPSLLRKRLDGKGASLYALKCDIQDHAAETEKLGASGHMLAATLHHRDGGRSDLFGMCSVPFLVKAVRHGTSFDSIPDALKEAHRGWDRSNPVRHLSRLHPQLAFSRGAPGPAGA